MPTPIELALSTLLPTIAFLPPQLITLATSFVAQSRSKAASLKPEEEIGRTYACAHIACERLANQLSLEVGKPVPPVKPRVYGKLKGYLDGVLEQKSRRGGDAATPTQNTAASTRTGQTRATPTSGVKRARPVDDEDAATPTAAAALPTAGTPASANQEVPDFVMPLIRAICKSNALPSLAPLISVGATYAVREIASRHAKRAVADEPSAKRRRRTPQSGKKMTEVEAPASEAVPAGKWPALCLALFLFTAAKSEGVDVQSDKMKVMREKGGQAVTSFCEDKRRVLPDDLRAQEGLESAVTFYMLEAEDCGWLEMEWFGNVPVREDGMDYQDGQDDVRSDDEEDTGPVTPRKKPAAKTPLRRKEKHGGKKAVDGWEEDVGPAGLLPGLGTMFQPAVDWLSDERRAEYAVWKKGILKELAVVDARA